MSEPVLLDTQVASFDNSAPANQNVALAKKIQDLQNGYPAVDTVETAAIVDLAVTTAKINDLAVTDAKLAADSVITSKILDLNVTTGKINDLAVTTGKINSLAVTTAKINDLAVTTAKLAANEVTPAKLSEIPFTRTATITSAAAATPINILLTADVPAGKKVYLNGFIGRVNGATVWATTATVKIQDNNGTPVDFVTIPVSVMTNAARVFPSTTNVVCEDAFAAGTGGTAVKGLQLVGDVNGTGSDFIVTVWGVIK